MGNTGPAFYDNEEVFTRYATGRQRSGNANDTLEKPIFDELIGDMAGLHLLDLGCGDAGYGRDLLAQGCASYTGLEGSLKMAEAARQMLAGTNGQVVHTPMESWNYPQARFDLVTARLSLHYIADLASLFTFVYQSLVPGGRFIFSVEHPVITSSSKSRSTGTGKRADWIVDHYFENGPRTVQWMGGEVVKYHRTVEEYFLLLQTASFQVETLRESRPQRAYFADEAEYRRRKRIPLMLFFVGCKIR